mgnify:CR=1 FL=1
MRITAHPRCSDRATRLFSGFEDICELICYKRDYSSVFNCYKRNYFISLYSISSLIEFLVNNLSPRILFDFVALFCFILRVL